MVRVNPTTLQLEEVENTKEYVLTICTTVFKTLDDAYKCYKNEIAQGKTFMRAWVKDAPYDIIEKHKIINPRTEVARFNSYRRRRLRQRPLLYNNK